MSYRNHDLRVPKKIWTELPAMVLECQFWNIDFVSDDVNLLASKLDEIYNKVVVARVKVFFSAFFLFPESLFKKPI